VAHNRTEIRLAVKALLDAVVSPTWANVYVERRHRIDTTLRPLVIISTGNDDLEPGNRAMGSPVYDVEHSQALTLELHADGTDGDVVADTIDAMELEVEAALASDLFLGGLVEMVTPVSSELEMDSETDRIIGVRSVQYLASWRSAFGAPDTPEA